VRIKIFCAPGNHRDDFIAVEEQVNEWLASERPTDVHITSAVNEMGRDSAQGSFMLTLVVQYEPRTGN